MAYKDPDDPRARESRRKHYQENREQYKRRNREKRERLRAALREVKSVPCADCRIQYPHYVMDLDHRDPETKSFDPANLVNRGSWRIFQEEIAKCDVVCANCHRVRTFGRS